MSGKIKDDPINHLREVVRVQGEAIEQKNQEIDALQDRVKILTSTIQFGMMQHGAEIVRMIGMAAYRGATVLVYPDGAVKIGTMPIFPDVAAAARWLRAAPPVPGR